MLQDSIYEPLIVGVSDRTPGIKQKARLEETYILETLTGLSVKMRLEVLPYIANADGSAGEPLLGNGIGSYPVYLSADNLCAVNPDTGEPLYQLLTMRAVKDLRTGVIALLEEEVSFADFVRDAPELLALQGDWFAGLLTQPSTPVRELQQRFILAADQAPWSKFVPNTVVDVIPNPIPLARMLPDPGQALTDYPQGPPTPPPVEASAA